MYFCLLSFVLGLGRTFNCGFCLLFWPWFNLKSSFNYCYKAWYLWAYHWQHSRLQIKCWPNLFWAGKRTRMRLTKLQTKIEMREAKTFMGRSGRRTECPTQGSKLFEPMSKSWYPEPNNVSLGNFGIIYTRRIISLPGRICFNME